MSDQVQLLVLINRKLSVVMLGLCIYKSLVKQIFPLHESKIIMIMKNYNYYPTIYNAMQYLWKIVTREVNSM